MYTNQQKAIIAAPVILALLFSFSLFIFTFLTDTTPITTFFFILLFNLMPAVVFSFLLGLYVYNCPNASNSLKFLLACGLIGGFLPIFWSYVLYSYNSEFLSHTFLALYAIPPAYLIGMLCGWIFGRVFLAAFPNIFKDKV